MVACTLLAGPLAAQTQEPALPFSDDYLVRTWAIEDGLRGNTVTGITQAADSYLWMVTTRGLARFDGARFTIDARLGSEWIANHRLGAVFGARDGSVWVGRARGVVQRIVKGRLQTIVDVPPKTEVNTYISSFAEDNDGGVWFSQGGTVRVGRWKNGELTFFQKPSDVGREAYARVHVSASGNVWLSTPTSCRVFDGNAFKSIHPDDGAVAAVTPAREGGMWTVRGGRLLRYGDDGVRAEIASFTAPGLADRITCLLEDRTGTLWLGTDVGLYRYRDGALARVPVSHANIVSLFADDTDQLWAGTAGGGLNRVRDRYLVMRQPKDGLNRESVYSLCEDTDGFLWISDQSIVPVRSRTPDQKEFAPIPDWPGGIVGAMGPDPKNGVWIVLISTNGVLRWQSGKFTREPFTKPSTAVLADRRGDVWIATIYEGLVRRHTDGTYEELPRDNGLFEPRALAEDAAGRIWVGTEAGTVFVRTGEVFDPVTLPEARSGEPVRFIVPDDEGSVWIGTDGGGLYRWHAGRVDRVPPDAGLPLENPLALAISPDGWLWLGGGRGLSRISTRELDDLIEGRIRTAHPSFFGRADGLPELEFTLGFRNAAVRTRDGRLWFSTQRGALEVLPAKLPSAVTRRPVVIEEVRVRDSVVDFTGALQLPPRPGALHIRYTLPEFNAPERLRFRYRLLGSGDDGWIEDNQDQRTAVLPQLPPGNYRFEVAAAGDDGLWQTTVTTLDIDVAAAWWQTLAFRLALVALAALALGALIRLILVRRLRARLLLLEQRHALDRERSRIARDMHDQVGASLTQISLMAEFANTPESVTRLAESARHAAESLDNIVWAVNPGKDTLASLLQYLARFTDDFLRSAGIRAQLDIPADVPDRYLPPDFRHHVFLCVKEALHNTVKYARASEVRLVVSLSPDHLTVTVADNGTGFDPAAPATGGGNGLRHLRERAAALNATLSIDSTSGTRLTLTAPWPTGA